MKSLETIRLYPPTASRFKDILTPTGRESAGYAKYLGDIIRWSFYGADENEFSSYWTERGKRLEAEARVIYCREQGVDEDLSVPKFVFNKEHKCGCYPDGLIGGGVQEIKCLKKSNHRAIVESGNVPIKFKPQIQGTLVITGAKWLDFIAYCPGEQFFIKRVEKDDEWCVKFLERLGPFNKELKSRFDQIYSEINK